MSVDRSENLVKVIDEVNLAEQLFSETIIMHAATIECVYLSNGAD